MATSGPNYPSVGESVSSGDANEVTWATPTNIQDADADEAQVVAATFDSPDPTFYLYGRGYGFTIPDGSTIDGITVEINRRSIIANSGVDTEVRLLDANRALIGDNKATATVWPTSLTIATYGGAADTWNTGLSASNLLAMVNDADFGVALQAHANIANADIGVSYIRVTITYTAPAPTGTGAIGVPPATVSGTGSLVLTGTGAVTVPAATVAGAGAEVFTATAAVAVSPPAIAGVGDHTLAEPTATGSIGAPAATVSGTGELSLIATGAIAVSPAAVAGLGSEVFTGTGAISTPSAAVAGSGLQLVAVTGTGAITIPAALVSGSGIGGEDEEMGIPAMGTIGLFRNLAVAVVVTDLKKKLNKELIDWLDWWD